jgi:hypothetical protein
MKEYLFNKIENLPSTISTILSQTVPTIGIFENDESCVFRKPGDDRIDVGRCEVLEIPIVDIPYTKGAVISNTGDLAIMIYMPNTNKITWGTYVFNKLKTYLISQGLRITLSSNDILLYNKKIGGYSESIESHGTIGVLFIAMEDAQDIVNTICLKHTDKQTAGLHDYGITTNEVRAEIIKASEDYLKAIGLEGGN